MYLSLNTEKHAGSLHPGPFSDGLNIQPTVVSLPVNTQYGAHTVDFYVCIHLVEFIGHT